ncbi:hypothetical protein COLO4_25693 [Corchorus olitorius]|uniref:F-box domain-containing protein n=1 Tax=Corchorus olitorius TaxID=93759 RepID=A0A1R3I0C5_9ROSI|nr:hypothetical protein COLO4_25693 [Corchorus olitorius]
MGSERESCELIPPDSKSSFDFPLEIVEQIFVYLSLLDRIRLRLVCKSWSVLNPQIPTTQKKFVPWAMAIRQQQNPIPSNSTNGELLRVKPHLYNKIYHMEDNSREGERWIFHGAKACASSYGWVLFRNESLLFLYSPFTTELIKLPNVRSGFDVATFSLDATSPKCLVFCLKLDDNKRKIYINLCSPSEDSWKTFAFGINPPVSGDHIKPGVGIPVHAAYGGGFFYCLFSKGELGAFDVGRQEWTMLTWEGGVPDFHFSDVKLIVSTESAYREILVLAGRIHSWKHQFLKFNLSDLRWVEKKDLNDGVLFIGCTCFSCPAVGEARELVDQVLSCPEIWDLVSEGNCYACTGMIYRQKEYSNWLLTVPDSMARIDALLCRKVDGIGSGTGTNNGNWFFKIPDSMAWIEFPLRGWVWRAKDLINAI